jgi:hypothetical protein
MYPEPTAESEAAFTKAIETGRLCTNPKNIYYVGNYMYMGHHDGKDQFKHIDTRQYID